MAKKIHVTPELIKQLEREGFEVKRKVRLVRKTFVVDEDVLADFMEVRGQRNVKIQDAVNEALRYWADRNRKR